MNTIRLITIEKANDMIAIKKHINKRFFGDLDIVKMNKDHRFFLEFKTTWLKHKWMKSFHIATILSETIPLQLSESTFIIKYQQSFYCLYTNTIHFEDDKDHQYSIKCYLLCGFVENDALVTIHDESGEYWRIRPLNKGQTKWLRKHSIALETLEVQSV